MTGFLLRIIINALVLLALMTQLPGMFVDTLGGTLLGASIIGLANAAIRPLMSVINQPVTMMTVGLVTFITNLITPFMVVKTLPGYQVSSMLASMAGIFAMTVCSIALTKVIQDR